MKIVWVKIGLYHYFVIFFYSVHYDTKPNLLNQELLHVVLGDHHLASVYELEEQADLLHGHPLHVQHRVRVRHLQENLPGKTQIFKGNVAISSTLSIYKDIEKKP